MKQESESQHDLQDAVHTSGTDIRFSHLLYRFLFFDWLFADMSKAKNLFERHAAWQHNKRMRRHLPTYLRRWSFLTAIDFGLGWLFEQLLHASVAAAWFFTWSCVTLTGMLIISILWVFLSRAESL